MPKTAHHISLSRLGFKAAAVDLTDPSAVLAEALTLAKATPQECGVLSTRQLRGHGIHHVARLKLCEDLGVYAEICRVYNYVIIVGYHGIILYLCITVCHCSTAWA